MVICKSFGSSSSVETYLNRNNYYVSNLDPNSPTLGLSGASLIANQNTMKCSFTRANSNSNSQYFNTGNSTNTYLIVAYGLISNGGNISY